MESSAERRRFFSLKEVFTGSHEGVSEGKKVGAIAEFLGEHVSSVDGAGNVFDLDEEVLFLAFAEKNSLRLRCLIPLVIVVLALSQHARLSS